MLPLPLRFNLLLSYVSGLLPFRYDFRTGRFEPCRPLVAISSGLALLWVVLHIRERKLSVRMKFPKVGMQDIIHAVENFVLNGNCVLIGVQQLLFLETYRQLLTELLEKARCWKRLARPEYRELLLQLVLLPIVIYLLHTLAYMGLVGWFELDIIHTLLYMVTLVPNMVHVNNFYALLFAHRLTLGEINDKLTNLWTGSVRSGANRQTPAEALPVSHRLQCHLYEYQRCAGTLRKILHFYSLPVVMYLSILLQELMSKFFYQFTYFYSIMSSSRYALELEVMGTVMIVVYGLKTVQLISNCHSIAAQSRMIKASVHRLSLVAGQDRHYRETVNAFLLSLNHSMLQVTLAGMFTLDFEALIGMVTAIANFVVLLMQFHIDYSNSVMAFKRVHNLTQLHRH